MTQNVPRSQLEFVDYIIILFLLKSNHLTSLNRSIEDSVAAPLTHSLTHLDMHFTPFDSSHSIRQYVPRNSTYSMQCDEDGDAGNVTYIFQSIQSAVLFTRFSLSPALSQFGLLLCFHFEQSSPLIHPSIQSAAPYGRNSDRLAFNCSED